MLIEKPQIFRIPGMKMGDDNGSFYWRGTSNRLFPKRTDGYKPSHWLFQQPGVTECYDYLCSRGGMFNELMMFGAQAHIMKYLLGSVVTPEQVRHANKFYKSYFGRDGVFNYEAWMDIATRLNGVLPLDIWALPEGLSDVPVQTPMLAYKNNDPKHAHLSGYLEPLMFKIWNTITVASLSQHIKRMIYQFLQETGTPETIIWKLHDFGYRGVSSEESAEAAGGAHLVNFWGTDTIPAIDFVNEFYSDGDFDEDGLPNFMPGFSVCATEHADMTQLGREGQGEIVKQIFRECPTGIIAMVGDSYNIFEFSEMIGTEFHPIVCEREGIVVIRPDSGEPIPTMMKVNWILGEKFGWTAFPEGHRAAGYRTFGKESDGSLGKIKTLQGDKNDYDAIYAMCRAYKGAMWSLDNLAAFGMGGALLQASTRDTQKMKIALSSQTINDEWRDIYKDPITDPGKGSKYGRFAVVYETIGGQRKMVTKRLVKGQPEPEGNLLQKVYSNGQLLVHSKFQAVRGRADEWMKTAA